MPVSKPEDSGSLIFNHSGGVIGLLTGIMMLTYFTPIKNVFSDIKEHH